MTADIVNLRKFRKAKARTEKQQQAVANREKFGRTKGDRERAGAEVARATRHLDGTRREVARATRHLDGTRRDGDPDTGS